MKSLWRTNTTLQLEQTKIQFNIVSARLQISQARVFPFKISGIWKTSECLSESILATDVLMLSFTCGTRGDAVLPITVPIFWGLCRHQKNKLYNDIVIITNMSKKKIEHIACKTSWWLVIMSSTWSFRNEEFLEEAATAAAAAARTACASLCLFSLRPRFFASRTSRRNWLTSTRSHLCLFTASSSRGRLRTTLNSRSSAEVNRKPQSWQAIT